LIPERIVSLSCPCPNFLKLYPVFIQQEPAKNWSFLCSDRAG
jgi:hypothetical protein